MVTEADHAERTFCFVDLAGFTALTEAHGDSDAVALLDQFLVITRQALAPGDELVKTIGDAVMLASPAPEPALLALNRLMDACHSRKDFPLPRAGAHHGSAVIRDGDYLGGAVNLAARVAGQAGGSQLLVTSVVAQVARQLTMEVVALGPHRLRNVSEPIDLFEIRVWPGAASHTVDPVCRMNIDRERAAGFLRHNDRDHWFCSLACVAMFAADPDLYAPLRARG